METVRGNTKKIYLYYIFRSFIFAYVIERLFWASRGMSVADTVYTEFAYAFAMIFLEVPSGLWADRFGRKAVIVIGSIFNVVASFMMLHIYGLGMFIVAIVLSAFNGALTSGSVNALIYDSLMQVGEKSQFEKVISRIKILRYGSGLMAAFLGAYFATRFDLVFNYQLSLVSTVLALVMALSLKEPSRGAVETEAEEPGAAEEIEETEGAQVSLGQLIRMSFEVLKNDVTLRRMMVTAGAIGGAIVYIEEF